MSVPAISLANGTAHGCALSQSVPPFHASHMGRAFGTLPQWAHERSAGRRSTYSKLFQKRLWNATAAEGLVGYLHRAARHDCDEFDASTLGRESRRTDLRAALTPTVPGGV